jgi:hypothetical protein
VSLAQPGDGKSHDARFPSDLAGLLKRRAWDLGLLFKEVVNRTIRAGLCEQARSRSGGVPKTIPHSFGLRPDIDPDKFNQLAEESQAPCDV